ncbi:MAG TPA: hypothetical protein VFS55_09990 [Dokdonella sp.]|nr:hypothetical protein [Dokdonella sp.]
MFVAPLSAPSTASTAPVRPRTARPHRAPAAALAAWLLVGLGAIALFPALRGGDAFGSTLPFWLVAAPAIDLAWLARARIAATLAAAARRLWRHPATQARRLQGVRRARRSSRK